MTLRAKLSVLRVNPCLLVSFLPTPGVFPACVAKFGTNTIEGRNRMEVRLDGRSAIITGASMGLGLAMCARWSPAGLPAGLTAALVGVALTAILASWSNSSLRYCDE